VTFWCCSLHRAARRGTAPRPGRLRGTDLAEDDARGTDLAGDNAHGTDLGGDNAHGANLLRAGRGRAGRLHGVRGRPARRRAAPARQVGPSSAPGGVAFQVARLGAGAVPAALLVAALVWPAAAVASPAGSAPDVLAADVGWRWPLPGRPEVARGFDPPDASWGSGHRGVDLAAAPGTPVLAAGRGVVSYAGVLAGRGVVAVRHDGGLRTTYEPLAVTAEVGQRVAAGDVIGLLTAGHPGCPRTACLHWGLLRGDTYLDPLSLLGAGPVRLLPLAGAGPAAAPGGDPPRAAADQADRWVRLRSQSTTAAFGLALVGALALARRRP
jgi:murein DD-endopeptidase MepM/ murein hydrolase activator NlpD